MACIHQKAGRLESVPETEPPDHVEACQTDHDDGGSRLPGEAMLDRLKRRQPVSAQIAAPHRRQRDGGRHRDPADPDHDEQDVQRPGDDHVIHEFPPTGQT
jgi:hypothetical protein